MANKTFIQVGPDGVIENTFIVGENNEAKFIAALKKKSPSIQLEDVSEMEIYPTPGCKKIEDDFESIEGKSLKELAEVSKAMKRIELSGQKATEELLQAELGKVGIEFEISPVLEVEEKV